MIPLNIVILAPGQSLEKFKFYCSSRKKELIALIGVVNTIIPELFVEITALVGDQTVRLVETSRTD